MAPRARPGRAPTYVSIAYSHAPTDPRVRRHCETMARQGWRVIQLGLAAEGESSVGRLNGVLLVRRRRRRYRGAGLARYLLAYADFLVWSAAVLRRLGRRSRIGVVHVNNIPNFMVWAATGARRRGAGVILDLHDPVPELFRSKFGDGGMRGAVARALALEEAIAAKRADLVLTVNEVHRQVTVGHRVAPERIRVIANRADGTLFPLGAPRRPVPFVAYHGTVAPRMGLDVLVEAVGLLRERGTAVSGAIWGDGDGVAALQALRDRLGLGDAMEVTGRRFRLEALRPRLDAVGIGVVTVQRDVFTDIMLPTKLIEYVRLGIPAIACRTPTIAHYFPDDTVWYLTTLTPSGLADAIEAVLADPASAVERARKAQQLPIAQAWQDYEAEFVELVEEVARRGNGTTPA